MFAWKISTNREILRDERFSGRELVRQKHHVSNDLSCAVAGTGVAL